MIGAVAALARRTVARLDHYQRRHRWAGFPLAVLKKFSQDRAGAHAGLIAYYGFFSLFPLILLFVTVLGFVLGGDPVLEKRVIASVSADLPSLAGYLKVGSFAGSGLALAVGVVASVWMGLAVAQTAERAMSSVWDVPVVERPNFWLQRARSLGLLATLGTVTVASMALASLHGVGGPLAPAYTAAAWVGTPLLNLALYVGAFRVLTSIRLTTAQVLPGALVGAAAWTALQLGGNYFVRHQIAHASHLYGTFAVVIGLLAWIHVGAQATLYAAEVNVVVARRLWPRALTGDDLTDADRRAYESEVREHDRLHRDLGGGTDADRRGEEGEAPGRDRLHRSGDGAQIPGRGVR